MNKKILAILLTSIISANTSNVTASGNTATSALKYAVYAGVAISGCVALKELYTYTQNLNASLDTTDGENTESTEEGYTEPGATDGEGTEEGNTGAEATGEENTDDTDEGNSGPGATDGENTEEGETLLKKVGETICKVSTNCFEAIKADPRKSALIGVGTLAGATITIGVIVHIGRRNAAPIATDKKSVLLIWDGSKSIAKGTWILAKLASKKTGAALNVAADTTYNAINVVDDIAYDFLEVVKDAVYEVFNP